MSKSELNILRFLEGEATPEEMKKLQKWSAKKAKNQSDLAATQEVYNVMPSLREHKRVDVDQEWASFMTSIKSQSNTDQAVIEESDTHVSEIDILQYVDGTADHKLRTKVEAWGQQRPENLRDLKISSSINNAVKKVSSHKVTHVASEYIYHENKRIKKSKPQPTISHTEIKKDTRILPMWVRYAAAASMTLLLAAFLFLYNPAPKTITYATGTHQLDDGSTITLDENSTLVAFADIDKVDKREVVLSGTGTFEIAKMDEKPFLLSSDQSLGIDVTGTEFSIAPDPEFLSVISTIEGQVAAFDVKKPEEKHVINIGESLGFSEDGFTKIVKEEPEVRETKTVLQVLDYLMENSNWKVISSPSNDFRLNDILEVNLDKPYNEIIEQLSEDGFLTYVSECEGCYKITSFRGE